MSKQLAPVALSDRQIKELEIEYKQERDRRIAERLRQPCTHTDAQWAEVEQELERKPYHRAAEVVAFVKERFGLDYTERGMQALHVG